MSNPQETTQSHEEKSEQTAVDGGLSGNAKKSKKNKHKGDKGDEAKAAINGSEEQGTSSEAGVNFSIQEIRKAMEVFSLQQRSAKTPEEALQKQYQFWSTQPVPKIDEKITSNGPIEDDKSPSEIRAEPYSLPPGFQWDTLNLDDPLVLEELYKLLNENYVEDEDSMFRFDYPQKFLQWALQAPGWCKEWHCGVRASKSKILVAFISAIPATLSIYGVSQKMVEINFLCVHKKLRSKRVAPVLIREITRRVNLKGLFQAVYTAGVVLPKPVGTCRYWHRSLNPKKLIEVKFSHLSRNMTMKRTLKLYGLPETTRVPGFRALQETDVPKAHKILCEFFLRFDLAPIFTEEEFKHWLLPRDGIVYTFIVENGGDITDLISYYTLPSTVMNHETHKSIKAAYSFYNVSFKTKWVDLMQDALITAKNEGFDVFNALDLMENKEFLGPLKFGIGDGNLQYYLYNWKCPSIPPNKIGLVLQ